MQSKRKLTVLIALLMTICMLFNSCFETAVPNEGDSADSGEHTHETDNGETTQPDDPVITPVGCTHATTTLVNAVEASCTAEGYTGDTVCTNCAEIVTKGSTVPMAEHSWGNAVETKTATCMDRGINTYTCGACGTTKTEYTALADHDHKYHDALDGTHMHTCTTCTMNENNQHNPVDADGEYHAPSCEEPAYTEYVCADCLGVYKVYSEAEADKATGHDFSNGWVVTKEANCSHKGAKTHECKTCGTKESISIAVNSNAHVFLLVETTSHAATCTESGELNYTCKYCTATKRETPAATGVHVYEMQADQGDGWTVEKCRDCGKTTTKFTGTEQTSANIALDKLPVNDSTTQEKTSLDVSMGTANIQFPAEAIDKIKTEGENVADAKVSIGADVVDDTTKQDLIDNADDLDQAKKDALANADIYDFNVSVGDTKISEFGSTITVTLPYTLKENEDPEGIVVWYVTDDGKLESKSAIYDAATQTVVFFTDHFSYYAVAYEETQAIKCRKGNHSDAWDESKTVVVPATCWNYGYTVLTCGSCGYVAIDHIEKRLEHAYGDVITVTPTCTEGGYDHQICQNEGCGHVKNVSGYKRALGHKLDQVATCTEDSTCTVCETVVTPALGHRWTVWEVAVQPGEVTTGLRRRYCPACGEVEEVVLAATGNIEKFNFKTYQDLYEFLFQKVFGAESGKFNVSGTYADMSLELEAKMTEENGSFLMLVVVKVKAPELLETEEEKTYNLLYKNGILLGIYDENGQIYVTGTDVNFLTPMSFDTFWEQLEQTFNLADPQISGALFAARELLAEYLPICGSAVNAALAAAKLEYTAEQLVDVLDEIENLYAYFALKMGFTSMIAMNKEEIELPKLTALTQLTDKYMTRTENSDGSVTYELDVEQLEIDVTDALGVVEEIIYKPLSELIYGLIDEKLTETYPELTDWNACYEKLCESFAGSMTVKDAINRLIPILEASEICTLDELYDMINQIVIKQTGEAEFNVKAVINEYRDLSLDDLLAEMSGEEDMTAEIFYEMMNEMLSEMTLDDILRMSMGSNNGNNTGGGDVSDDHYDEYIPSEPGQSYPVVTPQEPNGENVNFSDRYEPDSDKGEGFVTNGVSYNVEYTYGELNGGSLSGDGQFELGDGNMSMGGNSSTVVTPNQPSQGSETTEISVGMLLDQLNEILDMVDVEAAFVCTLDAEGKLISLNFSESVTEADDGDATTEPAVMEQATVSFVRDASITVEIPVIMNPVLNAKIETSYDAQGNLIIKGLDPNYTYSFRIYGYSVTNLAEVAEEAYTDEGGYPVYVLPKGLWSGSLPVENVVQIGDKYYRYESINRAGGAYIAKSVKLSEVLSNPMLYVPEETDPVVGYYSYGGMEIPIYESWFGPMFYADGQWNIAVKYTGALNSYLDGNGNKVSKYVYNIQEWRGYEKLMFNAKLDTVSDDDWNGNMDYTYSSKKVHLISVTVRFNSDMPNRTCLGYYKDSVLYLVQLVTPEEDWQYQLTEELRVLPEHDSEYENNFEYEKAPVCIGLDGNTVTEEFTVKTLYKRVPAYYVKADDKTLIDLNSSGLCNPAVSLLDETVTLPSGKTMYVWETMTYEESGRKLVYGYTKLAEELYLQTVVEYLDGELQKVVYRNAQTDRHCAFNDLYDLRSFMVQNPDGSYTVKAELINKLKAACTDAGDAFAFVINGIQTVNGVEYNVDYMVGAYAIPEEITGISGGQNDVESNDYGWEWIFGNQDGAQGYKTKINDDGSLSIFFHDGRVITDFEIHLGDRLPATTENILESSGETTSDGLPIYSYEVTEEYSDSYVYKNGKYYNYDIYTNRIATYFDDAKTLLKNFYLRNLTAQYVHTDPDTQIEYQVYSGEMAIRSGKGYYEESSAGLNNLYFLYDHINGTLYVLRGVNDGGETILSFEEKVTWEQYVDKLSVQFSEDYTGSGFYLNGEYRNLNYATLILTELDENGNVLLNENGMATIHRLSVRYINDGDNVKFVRIDGYSDDIYVKCDERKEVQLDGYQETERWTETFKNETVTICTVVRYRTSRYNAVKLGDGFYYLYEYEKWKLTEEEFLNSFKSQKTFFECDGVYYDSIEVDEKGCITLGKMLQSLPTSNYRWSAEYYDKENGLVVREYVYFVDGGEKFTEELPNGTVYHYTEGCAFLELTNGYYVKAYKVGDKIYCENMGLATIPDSLIVKSGVLDDYISINADKTVITVSNDALDFLADYRYDFSMELYANGYNTYISYNTLQNLLQGNKQ